MSNPNNPETFSDETLTHNADSSFGEILSQFEHEHPEHGGKARVEGTVIAVTPESVFVDIGRKTEGIIPIRDVQEVSGEVNVQAGDRMVVSVLGRNQEGYYELSTIKVERPKDWSG